MKLHVNVKAFLLFIFLLVFFLGFWQILIHFKLVSSLVPSPSKVFSSGWSILQEPFYQRGMNDVGIGWQLLSSLQRVLIGFFLAAFLAVPIGFLIGLSPVASKAIDPFIQILKPVSPLAWLPIGLALLQDSEKTAIFIIFISSIWPIMINTIFGVRNLPTNYIYVSQLLEVDRWTFIQKVLFPAALPQIINGLRVSLGVAWLVIIAAEMLVGGKGIGYFIWNEWNNLNIANIIVAIILIGLIGIILDRILGFIERKVRYGS